MVPTIAVPRRSLVVQIVVVAPVEDSLNDYIPHALPVLRRRTRKCYLGKLAISRQSAAKHRCSFVIQRTPLWVLCAALSNHHRNEARRSLSLRYMPCVVSFAGSRFPKRKRLLTLFIFLLRCTFLPILSLIHDPVAFLRNQPFRFA